MELKYYKEVLSIFEHKYFRTTITSIKTDKTFITKGKKKKDIYIIYIYLNILHRRNVYSSLIEFAKLLRFFLMSINN